MTDAGGVQISRVDPFDDAAAAAWHAVVEAALREGMGAKASVWTLPEMLVDLRQPGKRRRNDASVGRTGGPDGPVVVAGVAMTPLLANLRSADLGVLVGPAHRRHGFGTAMLRHLEDVAAAAGRTLLTGESSWPYDLGADGAGWPGREFARAHGYTLALGDVQRAVDLPIDDDLLARLAAGAAPHHAGHTLLSWVGRVPDELALGWCTLTASLMTEAPTGEKVLEPERPDVEALRQGEAKLALQGRTRYATVALDAAGEVAAYTDVVSTVHEPGRAYQWGTLVRRADRGHRLGLAVKVANHQQLQRERPDLHVVTTYNAEVNDHMIGVNEQLGFRRVARLGEFEKRA